MAEWLVIGDERINKETGRSTVEADHFREEGSFTIFYSFAEEGGDRKQVRAFPTSSIGSIERQNG